MFNGAPPLREGGNAAEQTKFWVALAVAYGLAIPFILWATNMVTRGRRILRWLARLPVEPSQSSAV